MADTTAKPTSPEGTHDLIGLPAGAAVGRYAIRKVLGQGSFGITYLAHDGQLGRDVALKEYLPTAFAIRHGSAAVMPSSTRSADDFAWGRQRFVDEARTLAGFQSVPGVVRVYDFLEANGTAYMVMELVQGVTLEERLEKEGPLAAPALERILGPLLDGLAVVHQAGFVHRDIKPANILLDAKGHPTLIDFGAARAAIASRTTALTAIYTPSYAAPEQFTDAEQGPWTDIYGLAATLYLAISGKKPPRAIDRLLEDRLKPLAQLKPAGYPAALLSGLDRALAVRAADRPQDVEQWRALLYPKGTAPKAVGLAEAPRRRLPVLLYGGVGLVAVIGLAAFFAFDRPGQKDTLRTPKVQEAGQMAAEQRAAEQRAAEQRAAEQRAAEQRAGEQRAAEQRAAEQRAAEQRATEQRAAEQRAREAAATAERAKRQADEDAATRAFDQKDYVRALELSKPLAEAGSARGQRILSQLYYYGTGVPQDYAQAAAWARKSAEQGYAPAQNGLGFLYDTGHGVAQDYGQAIAWYRKAADQGYASAQYNLGVMHRTGRGLPQDSGEAAVWFRKAADQGHAGAEYNLGEMYRTGHGLPQDYAQATAWYRKAADQGNAMAQADLGRLYDAGLGVPRDYGQAVAWYRKAADQGNAAAQHNLGVMYRTGHGVPQDYAQAPAWFRKAADQSFAMAQAELGYLYARGEGVPQDFGQAAAWYRKAADQGNAMAQTNLGNLYDRGQGVPQDYGQAAAWYRKAADQGNATAQNNLGILYEKGQGVARDYNQAAAWFRKAASQGYASAQQNLDALIRRGLVPRQ